MISEIFLLDKKRKKLQINSQCVIIVEPPDTASGGMIFGGLASAIIRQDFITRVPRAMCRPFS